MANTKITALTELAETPATNDLYPVVDVSDTTMAATGTNKYIQAFRIVHQNGGSVGLTGDLGLGTATPSYRLHILDSATENLRVAHTSASGQPFIGFAQTTTRRSYIQHNNTNHTLRFASEFGDISFETAATAGSNSETEYMRIKAGGRVGIGTSSPNSQLEVVGTVQMDALRLDQTPTAGTFTATHYITVNLNGTNYRIACAV